MHTPAPWKTYNGSVWSESKDLDRSERSNVVCTISSRLMVPEKEKEANAHLIAAAPDLLGWLEKAVQMLDQTGEDAPQVGAWEWVKFNSRAAIAKARGENH